MATSRRTQSDMYPLVAAYLTRGERQKAFCETHTIPEPVFNYGLSKFRRGQSPASAMRRRK